MNAVGIDVSKGKSTVTILIRNFGDDSLRSPKTDKANSKKIARYTLDRWTNLTQYGGMDKTRNQLKTMNRQFGFYMD